MIQDGCTRCGQRSDEPPWHLPTIFHAQAERVCPDCVRPLLPVGFDLVAFAENLLVTAAPGESPAFDLLPDARTCGQCGLTFGAFRATGLLGCSGCYRVFSAVIGRAVELLHGVGAPPQI